LEATANWKAKEVWTAPVLFSISKVTMLGKRPVNLSAAAGPYVVGPNGGPSWRFRLAAVFLYPKMIFRMQHRVTGSPASLALLLAANHWATQLPADLTEARGYNGDRLGNPCDRRTIPWNVSGKTGPGTKATTPEPIHQELYQKLAVASEIVRPGRSSAPARDTPK
jgi:hypothetical protein